MSFIPVESIGTLTVKQPKSVVGIVDVHVPPYLFMDGN